MTSRVVVLTGASSGIGRAAALAFAQRGERLVLAARGRSGLDTVADHCRAAGAAGVRVVPADVTVADEVVGVAGTVSVAAAVTLARPAANPKSSREWTRGIVRRPVGPSDALSVVQVMRRRGG